MYIILNLELIKIIKFNKFDKFFNLFIYHENLNVKHVNYV